MILSSLGICTNSKAVLCVAFALVPTATAPLAVALADAPTDRAPIPVAVAPLTAVALVTASNSIFPRAAVAAYELPAPKRAAENHCQSENCRNTILPDLVDTSALFCSADDFTRPLANSEVTTKD